MRVAVFPLRVLTWFLCGVPLLFGFKVLAQDYHLASFGAVGDGQTLNTTALQAAIDQAHQNGGGRVVFPAGRFLSGSIVLKSNVELHLQKNAVLLGSTNPEDYIKIKRWKALVMAEGADNIAISGKGTLDGQGAELALHLDSLFYIGEVDSSKYQLKERRPFAPLRPQIIELVRCNNVEVTGVTIRNAASWVQTYDQCHHLTIDGIKVDSDAYWNNDGIDVTDSWDVRITNCDVNASDDGICLKSYAWKQEAIKGCDSILISNCRVRSSASAIKFGTASYSGFKNVVVRDIKVYDTFRSAIALEIVDGGTLENVLVENIKAVNTGNAIFIRLGHKKPHREVGQLKNVVIRNVKVQVPFGPADEAYEIRGPELPFFHNTFPASITGIPGHPVENVTLENIRITYPGRGNKAYANMPLDRIQSIPEQINLYPEYSMFGELPAWGFYVRHVEGIDFKNIRIKAKKPDYRPAFVFDDVDKLKIEDIEIKGDTKSEKFHLRKVRNVTGIDENIDGF